MAITARTPLTSNTLWIDMRFLQLALSLPSGQVQAR